MLNIGEILGKVMAFAWFMCLVYAYMQKDRKKKLIALFICVTVIVVLLILIADIGSK